MRSLVWTSPKVIYTARQHLICCHLTDIATFSACVPPIAEALHLWDMMVAFGFHLNVLFVLAQLVRRRAKILSSTR